MTVNVAPVRERAPLADNRAADDASASLVVLAVVGAALGTFIGILRHGAGPGAAYVTQLVEADWAWLALGLAVCWTGRAFWSSAARGVAFLTSAVVGNYVGDALAVLYTPPSYAMDSAQSARAAASQQAWDLSALSCWLLLVTVVALWLAFLASTARRGGYAGVAAALVIPIYTATRAFVDYRAMVRLPDGDPIPELLVAGVGVTAVIVTAAVLLSAVRGRPRRAEKRDAPTQ